MKMLARALTVVSVWTLHACSTPSNEPNGTGGSSQGGSVGAGGSGVGGSGGTWGSGGASGSGGTVPACNQLAEDAPTCSLTWASGVAPTPKGGSIADGSYVVTRQTGYTETTLPEIEMGRVRVEIAGSTWQEAEGIPPYDVNPDQHRTYTLAVQGTALTLTRTCPSAGEPNTSGYTADAASLTIFFVDQGTTFETVFTRQ
jgi:hypothetical protein